MSAGWGIRTIKSKQKSNAFNSNRMKGFGEVSDMHSTVAATN